MWLARPTPTQRQPSQDPVAWARDETWTFTIWKCEVYTLLLSVDLLLLGAISKGMPGDFLWRWLSIPVLLAFACLFTAFSFYVVMAIGELIDRSRS